MTCTERLDLIRATVLVAEAQAMANSVAAASAASQTEMLTIYLRTSSAAEILLQTFSTMTMDLEALVALAISEDQCSLSKDNSRAQVSDKETEDNKCSSKEEIRLDSGEDSSMMVTISSAIVASAKWAEWEAASLSSSRVHSQAEVCQVRNQCQHRHKRS